MLILVKMKQKTDNRKEVIEALKPKKKFDVSFGREVFYAVEVEASSKEEVEEMWVNGEIDWEDSDATDESYIENSLDIEEVE